MPRSSSARRARSARGKRQRRFETLENRVVLSGVPPLAHHGLLAGPSDLQPASSEPALLHESDFNYLGGFKVPTGTFGGSSFGWGGKGLAFNANDPLDPNDDTLFIVGHDHQQMVAEISIPSPGIGSLPTASVVQPFADVTDGKKGQHLEGATKLGGLLVHNDQLIWTAYEYYDADADAAYSHGTSSLDLSASGDAQGMYRVGSLNPGFTAGYMLPVPAEWQDEIGAPVLTGQSTGTLAIISRTSAGPALFAFDPADMGSGTTPATPLVYYKRPGDGTQELSTGMLSQNPLYNFSSMVGGAVFPEGTRSVVFFGGHGTGEVCYGSPEACNDPIRGGKGHHDVGGNYIYQAWAYDVLDLLAVKNGQVQPWEIEPYDVWEIEFPNPNGDARTIGATYDPQTNRVFVSQYKADGSRPVIHVYEVNSVPDTTAPAVSNVHVEHVSDVLATIGWTTDEAADSVVEFWTTANPASVSSVSVTSFQSSHQVQLTNLQAETSYGYRVKSVDRAGNETVSGDFGFVTDQPDITAPLFSNLDVSSITSARATVSWTNNEATTGVVEYWASSTPGTVFSASSASYRTGHSADLGNLQPTTDYGYRVTVSDPSGNETVSANGTFTTLETPPLHEEAVAFWTFDEAGGSTVADSTGNGQQGTLQGGATFGEGRSANAVHLDGSNDYVDFGNLSVSGNQLTLSAWVRADLSNMNDRRILAKATTYQEQSHYFMLSTSRTGDDNRLRFRLKTGNSASSGTTTLLANTGHLSPGAWYHLAATYDGSMMRLYMDGVEVGSVAKTGALATSSSVPFFIGANPGGPTAGTPDKYWDGQIDEVGIWNRAFGVDEIRALIDEGVGTPPSDTTSPQISNVMATGVTATEATISWTTNELSNSVVEYWEAANPASVQTVSAAAMTASHSLQLSGLHQATSYGYRVKSTDPSGNVATSSDLELTTLDFEAPVISSVSAAVIGATEVTVGWSTNEAANSFVEYWISSDPTDVASVSSASMTTTHSLQINRLQSDTQYGYRVRSTDPDGNSSASNAFSFTTLDGTAPNISGVAAQEVRANDALIVWSTDEAASGTVEYWLTSNPGSVTTVSSAALETSHRIRINALDATSSYGYRVSSTDANGNVATSDAFSFTTADVAASTNYSYDNPAPLPPSNPALTVTVSTVSELVSAVANLQSGMTVAIQPGTYDLSSLVDALYIPQGISDWTIRGATGDRDDVVITGNGMNGSVRFGFWIGNSPNGTIADLTLRDIKEHGVIANLGAHDMLYHGLRIVDIGDQFIKSNPNGFGNGNNRGTVIYSVFEYTTDEQGAGGTANYTNGVDVHAGDDWKITHNLFRNFLHRPGAGLAGPAILMWNGSTNTLAESNTFLNVARAIAFGLRDNSSGFDHSGGTIRNNMIYQDANLSNDVDVAIGVADSPNTRVHHNTVLNNGAYPNAIEYRFASTTNVDIRNNLVDAAIHSRNGATANVQNNATNASSSLFVNPAAGDLHLVSGASVIDQGIPLGDEQYDIDGDRRDAQPDLGADEFVGGGGGGTPPQDLGTVDGLMLEGQVVSGEKWYRLAAARGGMLTIETLFDHSAGNVDLEVYDSANNLLGGGSSSTDNERVDLVTAANDGYLVRVVGTTGDFSLRVTNLLEVSGDVVTVLGTAAADSIAIDTQVMSVSVNGVAYSVDASTSRFVVDGQAGRDRLYFYGNDGDDTATVRVGSTTVDGDNYRVTASNVEVELDGRGGNDVALLYDSIGDDRFLIHANGRYGTLEGTGFRQVVRNFERNYAYADQGGNDRAEFYDSAASDRFISHVGAGHASLEGNGFFGFAKNFESVTARANAGGDDRLDLYDSPGDDRFIAHAGEGYHSIENAQFYQISWGFETATARASAGGFDRAELFGTSTDDQVIAHAAQNYTLMTGAGLYSIARGFDRNDVYAGAGGADQVSFFDSTSDDSFVSHVGAGHASLEAGTDFYYAKNFAVVVANSGAGGSDSAEFFDSAGGDRFIAHANHQYSSMTSDQYYHIAWRFQSNSASAGAGGADVAQFFDTVGDDQFVAHSAHRYALMNGPGYYNIARGFERNEAFAGAGGTADRADFYDSASDDRFVADAGNKLATMDGGGVYNLARGFNNVRAFAGAGGSNDRVDFFDSLANDHFESFTQGGQSTMTGAGYTHFAKGFDDVRAHAVRGGTDRATLRELQTGGGLAGVGASAVYTDPGSTETRLWDFDVVQALAEDGQLPAYSIGDVDYIFEQIGNGA